ncbi:MAG: helix-turn-helix transcriptional regulator [Candidatus Marinimicrobia bacterium]|nr:helix-turn-helix transcriptional regulator [Candidatus Neomarinimicrobiota bacterium]
MNGYCKRLKIVRSELGISQQKMAKMLQIPYGTYRRYESGNTDIPAGVLLNVSQLGYSVDWFLTGEGKMRKRENTYLSSESKAVYNHPSHYQ